MEVSYNTHFRLFEVEFILTGSMLMAVDVN